MIPLRERSKITSKGQTTIPRSVRQALGVSCGGEIAYVVDERGVSLVRAGADEEADPVIDSFLAFLARDMRDNPRERVVPFPAALAERMAALTVDTEADPDGEIDGPVAL